MHKPFKARVRSWILLGVLAPLLMYGVAGADLNSDIRNLEGQVNGTRGQLNQTRGQISSLQGQIAALQAQIASLQARIESTQAQIEATNQQIAQTEAEIAAKKRILSELIRANYMTGQTTTLEVLASSDTLGQFFTKQQYILSVKDRIDQLVAQIQETKKRLDEQKTALEAQQVELESQRSLISQSEAAQSELLQETRGEEAAYRALLNGQQSELNGLYAQRAALSRANGESYYSGFTSYPFAGGAIDAPDPWGYLTRECTSYAAWYRAHIGKPVGRYGNAGSWPGSYDEPRVGDVAVYNYGPYTPYGHVAIVEAVNGNGTIRVSEFNYTTPYGFGIRDNVSPAGLRFLH